MALYIGICGVFGLNTLAESSWVTGINSNSASYLMSTWAKVNIIKPDIPLIILYKSEWTLTVLHQSDELELHWNSNGKILSFLCFDSQQSRVLPIAILVYLSDYFKSDYCKDLTRKRRRQFTASPSGLEMLQFALGIVRVLIKINISTIVPDHFRATEVGRKLY